MQGLEQMVDRVKRQLYMGRPADDIYTDLVAQGVHTELAHWAVKASQFEIEKEMETDNNGSN